MAKTYKLVLTLERVPAPVANAVHNWLRAVGRAASSVRGVQTDLTMVVEPKQPKGAESQDGTTQRAGT